ncbi:Asp23/Gls24 family envelope stress response protein [Aneurinibacillus sp. Ricciae_BoGa-3]|uniref:Asp23/Gls24 family envelope stress response protein n=1 Tax=Aneurinibacillus sp. Ricciae_BoGa-3 TaxID=3022697 RepID=UPI002340C713|nr:Asp23/Gls24 family envelope stress response protein [Aneurinibacillus sp. Ricciae_BoGa-3]WCK53363.1 Asp23/Gls24 family envelope stress response protein [Aneurinibacillus sp. Ricciae_BoGa-3]
MAEAKENGVVRIADDVVAVIAGIAASETNGIAGMSGGITEGLARRVSGKNVQKGVQVEVGEFEAAIDLRVIVLYGTKIDETCRALQENVKEAVESMTGLRVVEVNVKVEGVEFPREEKEHLPEVNRVK